jgi:hypothetical protein
MKNVFTLLSLLMIATFATSAFAGETDISAELRSLEAQMERQELHVAYEFSPKSWQAIQKAGIRPQLVLFEATKDGRRDYRYSIDLTQRRADIGFPKNLAIRPHDKLLVAIEGHRGFFHVDTTTFGEACGDMIPLDIGGRGHSAKDDQDRDHDRGHDRDRGQKAEKRRHEGYAASIIQACGDAMSHNSSECIKLAADLEPAFAAATIRACGNETEWDTEVQQCMRSAAGYKTNDPAPVITACGIATNWSSELMTCMTSASQHARPAEAVQACDAHTEWNSDLKQCLNASEPLGRNAGAIINACGNTTKWSSELTSCILKAGTLKHRG